MDGYAVRAEDTFGATESLPAYLSVIGEVPMGRTFEGVVGPAQAVVVYTGGMIPPGAEAGVMVERTQKLDEANIEVLRAVAPGENMIQVGEDARGRPLFDSGQILAATGSRRRALVITATVGTAPRVASTPQAMRFDPPEQIPAQADKG
jgi:molybdopterin molybdotransferase